MGYEAIQRVVTVEFDDTTSFEGFIFKARSVPIRDWIDLYSADDQKLIKSWSAALIEWNLENNGEPVPPTAKNIAELDPGLALSSAVMWHKAMARIESPKAKAPQLVGADLIDQALATLPD